MILYLDTSALVKRYVAEPGTQEVIALVEQAEMVGSVALTLVEMASALAKAVRLNWLEYEEAQRAWQDFLSHWPAFVRLSVTPEILERAATLAWRYSLRGYDATHLAGALFWQEALGEPLVMATFDRRLWKTAQASGLNLWPETLL